MTVKDKLNSYISDLVERGWQALHMRPWQQGILGILGRRRREGKRKSGAEKHLVQGRRYARYTTSHFKTRKKEKKPLLVCNQFNLPGRRRSLETKNGCIWLGRKYETAARGDTNREECRLYISPRIKSCPDTLRRLGGDGDVKRQTRVRCRLPQPNDPWTREESCRQHKGMTSRYSDIRT